MNTCSKGLHDLDVESNVYTRPDGGRRCRPCANEHMNQWRSRNRETARARDAARKAQARVGRKRIVTEAKSVPCADCGIQYPYYVMDLDHRPDEHKVLDVSAMVRMLGVSEADLRAEIAKCDAVCANCHRVRTFERMRP